jgi:hypothetical protein
VAAKCPPVIAQTRLPQVTYISTAGPTAQKTHCVHYEVQCVNAVRKTKFKLLPVRNYEARQEHVRGIEVQLPAFLVSAVTCGTQSYSRPDPSP